MNDYLIILYYKYTPIEDHVACTAEQRRICERLQLKGRIHIASEGINGTLSGLRSNIEQYMAYMHDEPLFSDIVFKIDEYHEHVFPKLSIRAREEVVTWRLPYAVKPHEKTGKRLTPREFHEHLQQDDVLVIDGRNDFEYDLGHFRGAIRPQVETTREFLDWIRKDLVAYKDRKIITCCTGGIRCEMLTAVMLEEGFTDVAQLDGGIVSYSRDPEVQGKLWDGQCYVFDQRISVPINHTEKVVVGRCHHCQQPTEKYVNCQYSPCNKQFLTCDGCLEERGSYCNYVCTSSHTNSPKYHIANASEGGVLPATI